MAKGGVWNGAPGFPTGSPGRCGGIPPSRRPLPSAVFARPGRAAGRRYPPASRCLPGALTTTWKPDEHDLLRSRGVDPSLFRPRSRHRGLGLADPRWDSSDPRGGRVAVEYFGKRQPPATRGRRCPDAISGVRAPPRCEAMTHLASEVTGRMDSDTSERAADHRVPLRRDRRPSGTAPSTLR